jgi:hypothetical protein
MDVIGSIAVVLQSSRFHPYTQFSTGDSWQCKDMKQVRQGWRGVVMNSKLKHDKPQSRWVAILSAALCLLCVPATVLAQTQLGADIDGEAAEDGSGASVSLSSDGNRLAIGALGNDGNGSESGHVRVYQWSGTTWTQLGADIDGEAAGDQSGEVSLSSDGKRLAIGAPYANGTDSGHVRVYEWSGSTWTQLGADIDGEAADDNFGMSVSLSSDGNRLAIGTPHNDGIGANSGHVRVYQWSGMAWAQLGADVDAEAAADYSGFSVSLSSDGARLAIGAIWNSNFSGHTRVYQWSGTTWTQLGADIDGEQAGDHSGWSVSLSSDGNRLAIGASNNDGNGSESGHVRVYQWSGTTWTQLGADIDGEAAGDRSGEVSLSSDGNRLAISAPWNDANGTDSGHVRVYDWSGSSWTQLGADIDGEAATDYSGAVSLSSDGNRLAIGASSNDGNGDHSGHVRVFDLSMFNDFRINPGLNDAWYDPVTNGQGLLITVFPDIRQMFVAWFTYDVERPPEDVTAMLGEPGHRWLTAQGPYSGDTATLTIYVTEGGVFDKAEPAASNDGIGDGTMTIEFADCSEGLVSYEITSPGISGEIPIQRIAPDNISLCETLGAL